jgi:hypothetical protein
MAANAGLGGQLAVVAADIGAHIALYYILCGGSVPNTLPQPQPATQDGAPTRLISLPLALTFLAETTSLTSIFLRLSAMPMLAVAAGAGAPAPG